MYQKLFFNKGGDITMQNIAIIGINSYIGTYFSSYLKDNLKYSFTAIDSMGGAWQKSNFNQFDVILHVAGIAHVSTDPSLENLYYEVNRDLPIAVAKKAKAEGVKHFIFFSSMIVYGDDSAIDNINVITDATIPDPSNFYGKSKLEAETGLLALQDENFTLSILRLPMVYGKGCKGNFPKLVAMASRIPVFPDFINSRSMIYIENLCAYLKIVVDEKMAGILFPQNSEYVSTKDIIHQTSLLLNHKIRYIKILNPLLVLLSKKVGLLRKIFGSKVYDKSLSPDMHTYNMVSFEESMKRYLS